MRLHKSMVMFIVFALLIGLVAAGCAPARRPMGDRGVAPGTPGAGGVGDAGGLRGTPGMEGAGGLGGAGGGLGGAGGTTGTAPIPPATEPLPPGDVGPNRDLGGAVNRETENRIQREIEGMNGVRNAVVLINENAAYVGVEMEGARAGQLTTEMRDQIVERVRRAEPTITRVQVSAETGVVDRLRGFGTQIQGGRPMTGFMREIEDLFRAPAGTR